MSTRGQFDLDLQTLQNLLNELSETALTSLGAAIAALDALDVEASLAIMENDYRADDLEEEINDLAILLIAKQQPVATDLRRIFVAIKIASDLERIADYAVNIAKSTIRIGNGPLIKPIEHIREMYGHAAKMIKLTVEAFNEEDVIKAKEIADIDDEIDALYGETIQELLALTKENPEHIAQITQLSFISRYLERAGDHATNIAENVFYLVKGRHYDLNK